MPIIIPEIGFTGPGVKKSQIIKLSENYYDKMKKKKLGHVDNINKNDDAKSVWFSKEVLDKLFSDNLCDTTNNKEFGLKIYFGVHETGILYDPATGQDIDPKYDNQQMVVLVVTRNTHGTKDEDQLSLTKSVEIAGYQGLGLDHGKLCPPEICTGSAI